MKERHQGKIAANIICIIFWIAAAILFSSCGNSATPEFLVGKTFVYDELNNGEGDSLYLLSFNDDEYTLYADKGRGILDTGTFSELTSSYDGTYRGSKYEEPAVEMSIQGKPITFIPATDTTEYVYLSYLGVYSDTSGNSSNEDGDATVLILDRWFEFYLLYDGQLIRGTYDVFSANDNANNGSTSDSDSHNGKSILKLYPLSPENMDEITAEIAWDGEFDISGISIAFKESDINRSAEGMTSLQLAEPLREYDAAHAMGTYTLSIYPEDIFTIKGVDGYLKAFGRIDINSEAGVASYFPRLITGEVEEDERYIINFGIDKENETYIFPESTPLLPRSGNIDKDTGLGSYWSAGTVLEFIKSAEVEHVPATSLYEENLDSVPNNFPSDQQELKPVMPTSGIAKPLALLIEFPDYHRPRHVTRENIEKLLFSLDESESLSSFYYRSSYGKLRIDGSVLDWYRTKRNRSDYESDTEVMAEAINHYIDEGTLNLGDFDSDGDGVIDALYVFWAGNMEGTGGMWDVAYRSTWQDSPKSWEANVSGYIFVPGMTVWSSVPPLNCNINSLIHETGHLLGLNDYYSYDTSERIGMDGKPFTGGALEGGLGGMDMMDTNIGDHNIFSKYLLGWASPTIIEAEDIKDLGGDIYEIKPSAIEGDGIFIKLKSKDDLFTELFVIEAVSPVRNSSEFTRLKEPVVRILHVNNDLPNESDDGNWRSFGFKYDNSYTSKKYIEILEADGQDEVRTFLPSERAEKILYEKEDYFTEGDIIGPNTYPNTNASDEYGNASLPTGLRIEIVDIADDGTTRVELSYEEPRENLSITDIDPSPVVVPYEDGTELPVIPEGTKTMTFTFNEEIEYAMTELSNIDANAEEESKSENLKTGIRLISGNEEIDADILIDGNQLMIEPEGGFEKGKDYRVIIPANILQSKTKDDVINNYVGIFGFISE